MAIRAEAKSKPRIRLSKERVLRAAVELADHEGIEAVSMRRLGQELGVEAMSLYNHIANKEEILDGMVELVVSEVDLTPSDQDWKTALRDRILAARETMLRHKWAPAVLETRTAPGPAVMRYIDALVAIFRSGGFSYDQVHHALHALGSRVAGFTQELFEPDDPEAASAESEAMLAEMASDLPYVVEMMQEIVHVDGPDDTVGWCDDQTEFLFAIDLILDGLERMRDSA